MTITTRQSTNEAAGTCQPSGQAPRARDPQAVRSC